ncbi:xylose isomerase [Listeria weihenstephanensis]|uniref:Xylose isomerase n=1 Tax=Listeria weihenstephanensis TaxID=1006155 RepID=A0A1S7FXP4_9LIST|nr:xylose isomerase [Listeria weihenstephanensis]AQY52214.1 xylose isomerase [Listeria weihenstephanensis]MBC1500182.1 xylose isomerase [Listeria weihenstephanensis]
MSYFPNVKKVQYEGAESDNPFAFRHYNPEEIVLGKPMKEHLRFAVAYWHTLTQDGSDPFGQATNQRTWLTNDPLETAKNRVEAGFEFFTKLDVPFYCFHDIDIAPEGASLAETFKNQDIIVKMLKEKQDETGVKLLWNTANMFSNPRYVHGAASTSNADVYAYAAAQVKKALEVGKELGGENYVFWGGREGYESLLNTDMGLEQDNMARFFHMAKDYAREIGFDAQFLIEPKPKEPSKHQYDFDAATTMAFLQKYDLAKDFKLNLEANHATLAGHTFDHELNVARCYGALGSIDANQGDLLLGWDTDEFPTDLYAVTLAMHQILENGGIGRGGVNFDAKVRRASFEMDDLFLAHIAGMDTFARGLKAAARMKEAGFLDNLVADRYASFKTGVGADIVAGKMDFHSLSKYAMEHDQIKNSSTHLEFVKSRLNDFLF